MILACGAVLHYAGVRGYAGADRAARAIYESVLEASAAGVRTPDLGGHATTSGFTSEVVARVRTKIDVWSSLGTRPAACTRRGRRAPRAARRRPCRASAPAAAPASVRRPA